MKCNIYARNSHRCPQSFHRSRTDGQPYFVGERFIWWNFVSSRKERIEQAKEDWKQGRIALPPDDQEVFIPLPDEKFKRKDPPPGALS